jgi:hypothetical protein
MMRLHPAAHLVVGDIPSTVIRPASRRDLVGRLAQSLRLGGVYAVALIPDRSGGKAVHVALERPEDAARLSQVVGASVVGRYPGWASQRSFLLDDALAEGFVATLSGNPARRARKRRQVF